MISDLKWIIPILIIMAGLVYIDGKFGKIKLDTSDFIFKEIN